MNKNSTFSRRILIIDDELSLLDLYREILESAGYEVATTNESSHVLEFLDKEMFDLILLDVMLPHVDGLHILKQVRQLCLKKNPACKVVLLSNLAQEDVMERAAQLGAAGYMIKSDYNPDEFLRRVKELL